MTLVRHFLKGTRITVRNLLICLLVPNGLTLDTKLQMVGTHDLPRRTQKSMNEIKNLTCKMVRMPPRHVPHPDTPPVGVPTVSNRRVHHLWWRYEPSSLSLIWSTVGKSCKPQAYFRDIATTSCQASLEIKFLPQPHNAFRTPHNKYILLL